MHDPLSPAKPVVRVEPVRGSVSPFSEAAFFCLAYLAVLLVGLSPFLHADIVLGDFGDNRFNLYILEHGFLWLTGQVSSFWNAPFFYPALNVTAYSDCHLGNLPLYVPWRLAGLDKENALQAWMALCAALNFAVCHTVLRRLGANRIAALAGAYVFAFGLPMMAQTAHAQLLPRFAVPVAFFAWLRFLDRGRTPLLAVTLAALVWQTYMSIYLGVFLALCLATLTLCRLVGLGGSGGISLRARLVLVAGNTRQALARLGLALVAAASLAPLAAPYMRTARTLGMRPMHEIESMLPRVGSWLHAPMSLVWSGLADLGKDLPAASEHALFVGATPLLAFLLLPWLARNRDRAAGRASGRGAGPITGSADGRAAARAMGDPAGRTGGKAAESAAALSGRTAAIDAENVDGRAVARAMVFWWTVVLVALGTLLANGVSLHKLLVTAVPCLGAFRSVTRVVLVLLFPLAVVVAAVFTGVGERLFRSGRMSPFRLAACGALALVALAVDQAPGTLLIFSKAAARERVQAVIRAAGPVDARSVLFVGAGSRPGETIYFIQLDAMLAAQAMGVPTINGFSGNFPRDYGMRFYELKGDVCAQLDRWVCRYGGQSLDQRVVRVRLRCLGGVAAAPYDGLASRDLVLDFSRPCYPPAVDVAQGLSDPEPLGRWTDADLAPSATIRFARPLPRQFTLTLTGRAFGPNAGKPVVVKVGSVSRSVVFEGANADQEVQARFVTDGKSQELEIIAPKPTRPVALGLGQDRRALGVCLRRLDIR